MNKQLETKLFKAYPDIFINKNNNTKHTQTPYPICHGIECDDGWFDLIKSLCNKLDLIRKVTGIKIHALQIKEKFGSLRFYINYDIKKLNKQLNNDVKEWQDIIYDVISKACDKSAHICEICGDNLDAETVLLPTKTYKTVCRKHLKWKTIKL